MSLLSWFSGKKNATADSTAGVASDLNKTPLKPAESSDIQYKPELIGNLTNDHQTLFGLYSRIAAHATANQFDEIPRLLEELKHAFQAHVLVENVHLYAYLEKTLEHDAMHRDFMRELRQGMNSIGHGVVSFAKRYSGAALDAGSKQTFLRELGEVGQLLTQRVKVEETQLYTLYQPSR